MPSQKVPVKIVYAYVTVYPRVTMIKERASWTFLIWDLKLRVEIRSIKKTHVAKMHVTPSLGKLHENLFTTALFVHDPWYYNAPVIISFFNLIRCIISISCFGSKEVSRENRNLYIYQFVQNQFLVGFLFSIIWRPGRKFSKTLCQDNF